MKYISDDSEKNKAPERTNHYIKMECKDRYIINSLCSMNAEVCIYYPRSM
jgi:hypothetical protein